MWLLVLLPRHRLMRRQKGRLVIGHHCKRHRPVTTITVKHATAETTSLADLLRQAIGGSRRETCRFFPSHAQAFAASVSSKPSGQFDRAGKTLPGFFGALPAEANVWGKDVSAAGTADQSEGHAFAYRRKPSRPLRSCCSSTARRRWGTSSRARTHSGSTPAGTGIQMQTGVALSGGSVVSGDSAVTAHLGGRVAKCQPRIFSIPLAMLPQGKLESGIPEGIHEPNGRLCCPGGTRVCKNFEKPIGRDSEFVPRPKTARPEGGCVIIHRPYRYPLPFWLKR